MTYSTARWGNETVVEFYLRNVVGGPGSFAVEARDFAVFGEALKRKLLLEFIAGPLPDAAGAVFQVTEPGGCKSPIAREAERRGGKEGGRRLSSRRCV